MSAARLSSASAIVALAFISAACGPSHACVAGIGICASEQASVYTIADPSRSQADQVEQQVAAVRAIVTHGPMALTVVRLGERQTTSTVVARVNLPKIDENDPDAVT